MPWVAEQVGDAPRVTVAMAGSGKDIAYLARPGRTIRSFDPQELSRCVVEGVFRAPAALQRPLTHGELVGYASTEGGISNMPVEACRLADYIAIAGDDYDRVCLAQALIRSTFQGRLMVWARDATAESMYAVYTKTHARLEPWRARPGTFLHTKGSVFDHIAEIPDLGVLFIDTPKVIDNNKKTDIYSKGWNGVNSILAQERQVLPRWTEETFRRDMPKLWNADYARMVFFHVTGAVPSPREVLEAMLADGVPKPTTIGSWTHQARASRTDVAWVVDR